MTLAADQAISPYKSQIRNPKKGMNNGHFISKSKSSDHNFAPSLHFQAAAGFSSKLFAPPPQPYPISQSFPPFFSALQQQQQLPPLLPLPALSKPVPHQVMRGLSCPPTNRKSNRTRDSSLTPKKPKPLTKTSKKDENLIKQISGVPKTTPSGLVDLVQSANPSGPDPKDVPNILSSAFPGNSSASISTSGFGSLEGFEVVDVFSESVAFTLSPPPSSLPLPTFSLRPKLSWNAQAGGIDAGATDDLRKLLRLR